MKDKFCLVGNPLKHSFSQKIHALLGDYDYSLQEVNRDEFVKFVQKGEFKGYNVTIPYKKDIIRLLDEIDERAKNIGAVNTVVVKNGKKVGYNTDFDGFIYMLNRAKISVKDKTILILGSGGTSLTATAVVKRLGAKEIMAFFKSLQVNEKKTIIMITHDMDLVYEYATRVIVMDKGRVAFDGDKETLFKEEYKSHHLSKPKILEAIDYINEKTGRNIGYDNYTLDDLLKSLKDGDINE